MATVLEKGSTADMGHLQHSQQTLVERLKKSQNPIDVSAAVESGAITPEQAASIFVEDSAKDRLRELLIYLLRGRQESGHAR